MNGGELKAPSPFGRPSGDTQILVLSELSLFIPLQNIENKILGLQYIGARLQYIGAPKCSWLIVEHEDDIIYDECSTTVQTLIFHQEIIWMNASYWVQ